MTQGPLHEELASFGPFFAVGTHRSASSLPPPWRPLSELTGAPDALAARIGQVREHLAAAAGCPVAGVEFRVAASITQLGLCARLLSPALGAAAIGRSLPVELARAWWIPSLGGPFPLSLPEEVLSQEVRTQEALPDGTGYAECLRLVAGPVTQIVRAVESMTVSPQVLWGNVASAVNGAVTMVAKARPELAAAAARAAGEVLRYPALAGTYRGGPGSGFRRRNCCLIYRLAPSAPASYCGDCVLGAPAS